MQSQLLTLSSLGPFQLSLANAPIAKLNSEKLSALLIYLVMKAGHKIRREHLAELLWPDMPTESARSNLRHAFFRLRQVLGDDENAHPFLLSGRDWLSFNQDSRYRLDAKDLHSPSPGCPTTPVATVCQPCLAQMESMANLYRGEFMADLSLPGCEEFNDWLQIEREAMRRRALVLLERLSVCHEQINGHGKALPYAQRYLELEPWNEEGQRRVMRLYALNNQASAALTQYEACIKLLKTELGVLPGIETQQLAESIRNGLWGKKSRVSSTRDGRTVDTRVADARRGDRRARDENKVWSAITPAPLIAERRQATVLYCELSHAGHEDVDEAMFLLQAPQTRCVEIIKQHFGHLVQTHGGGLLAYFGYPQAREDAALLAVQAALAATREAGRGIEIRAGVHTGLIITSGDLSVPDVVGKTSRLAIQLRQIARPGEVAISQKTHQLVAGYFDCAVLPGRSFSGIDHASDIFRVIKESGAHSRLEAAVQLTPLAGRKTEISRLLKLWKAATQGERHVLLVRGEAGIGKSRLIHTIKENLDSEAHSVRELRCFPEFSQSPFYPLVAMLETLYDFAADDTAELKIIKLSRYLQTRYPDKATEYLPFLAQLLSLPLVLPEPPLSPQQHKEKILAILLDLLHSLSARKPVLLVIEDLHWIDPSTLELVNQFVTLNNSASILTLFTARPEFVTPWQEKHGQTLELAPLAEDEVTEMVKSMDEAIPAAAIRQIVKRADGVPLFVEEMAHMVIADHQVSIPATLHDLLAARLDSMGKAKITAQLAASIGRQFDVALLRKVATLAPDMLESTLKELLRSGLLLEIDATTCQFKHALIQEAAYQSQTLSDRQAVHGRIAQTLQSDFPDVVANQLELLAQHLAAAGEIPQAIEYWIKAGQRAVRNSANLEAIGHFRSGLEILAMLPSSQDRDRIEFTMLLSLCPVLYAAKGYGSAEASQANARLSALSGRVGDSPELFLAKWALVMNTIAGTGSRGVPETASQLLKMAHDDPLRKQAAHYAIADASFWLGNFEAARSHTEQAIALYHPQQRQLLLKNFGEDLSISCSAYLSWSLYFLGFPDRAQQVCAQMLERARELDHPHTLGLALCFASVLHRWLNKPAETLSFSAQTIAISRQHDYPVWLAAGEMAHGWALAMLGMKGGITELETGITGMRATIGGISVVFLSALIEACVHLNMYAKALDLVAEAETEVLRTEDGHFTAELHRLKGECLLKISAANETEAEACLDQALTLSRKQMAKSLELRASISLARMWQKQRKQVDARHLLEQIYGVFTEGLSTADLQEAKALLQTLA